MNRNWSAHTSLAALLAAGVIAAGCGGDGGNDDGDSAGSAGQQSSQSRSASGAADRGPARGGEATPAGKRAVAACERSIRTAPDSLKGDLEELCQQAASGDHAAVAKANRDVCVKVASETATGAARTQAIESCKRVVR